MLGHKTRLNTLKNTEIISSFFFHHNGIKLGIRYQKKKPNRKNPTKWSQNNILLNKQWVIEEIKEEILKTT